MAQHHRAHERSTATESKFYLPAVVPPSIETGRVERLWASLFDHRIGAPK